MVFNKRRTFHIFYFFLLCLILLPENLVNEMEAGLDPSWKLAIGLALKNNFSFGTDFIFTYGPMGFLKSKYLLGTNKWIILLAEAFITGSFVYGIRNYIFKHEHWLSYILLLLLCISIKQKDTIHLLFPCFIIHAYLFLEKEVTNSLWICAFISCMSFFIKVNYGIISVILFYGIVFASVITGTRTIREILPAIIVNFSILISLGFFYHVDFKGYIISAFHLTKSYNDAMAIQVASNTDPAFVLSLIAVLLIITAAAFALKNGYRKLSTWANIFLACSYFFLLFKNGFVRSDETHYLEFISLLPIPFLLIAITSEKYSDFRNLLFMTVTLTTFIFTKAYNNGPLFPLNYFRQIVTDVAMNDIVYGTNNLKYEVSPALAASAGNETTDIFPWEIAALYKNRLNYDPRPVIQSYSAYDYYLDSLNAEKIKSGKGSQNILYSNDAIDSRVPFWEESITKRQILFNYYVASDFSLLEKAVNSVRSSIPFSETEFCRQNTAICKEFRVESLSLEDYFSKGIKAGWYNKNLPGTYNYILLKKRHEPLQEVTNKVILDKQVGMGEKISIPDSDGLIYLYADVKYSLKGKLKSFLFHPDPLYVTFTDEDGSMRTCQAIVPILKTGVLVNLKVLDNADAYLFFKYYGEKNKKVKSLTFIGSSNFDQKVNIKLIESHITQ